MTAIVGWMDLVVDGPHNLESGTHNILRMKTWNTESSAYNTNVPWSILVAS